LTAARQGLHRCGADGGPTAAFFGLLFVRGGAGATMTAKWVFGAGAPLAKV